MIGKPKHAYFWVCLLFFCMLSASAAGQSDAEEEWVLETIRVTASPIIEGNTVDRHAGIKTVVSEEQMENLNAQDIATALRKTPGVNISRYNPIGSFGGGEGGAIFIRGMGASRPGAEIKTYVDDVPMYMSIWNHPLLDLLSIDPAESVEVYKSPQPQHFGNAAAAVNLVPKKKRTDGFLTKAEIAGGSYDTFVGTAETAGKHGRLDYYAGGGYRRSNGHRDHSEGEMQDAFARIGYRLSDHWDVYAFGLFTDNFAEDPGKEGDPQAMREGTYETRAYLTSLTLSHDYAGAEGYIKVYRNAGEGDWLNQPTKNPGVREDLLNDFTFTGYKIREKVYPWTGGELLAGLDWQKTEGDYRKYFSDGTTDHWGGHDFTLTEPYAALSHRFGDRSGLYVIPSAGARFYDNSDFDSKWAPHAGLVVGYHDFRFHTGYSRGVIYPGLDVVVFSEEIIQPLGMSWKDLDPEIMDHYEAGVSYQFGNTARAELTYFYNKGKDRYVIVFPPPPPPAYANIETYTTRGVETSFQVYPAEDLSIFLGATVLDTDPEDLPYSPEITVSFGFTWEFMPAWTLNIDGQYVDDMYVTSRARVAGAKNTAPVDDYFLLNGKISRGFELADGTVAGKIFLAGENLTDTDYEYLPGYPMAGINGMAGISIEF